MPYDEVLLLPPNSGNKRARANLGILAVTQVDRLTGGHCLRDNYIVQAFLVDLFALSFCYKNGFLAHLIIQICSISFVQSPL